MPLSEGGRSKSSLARELPALPMLLLKLLLWKLFANWKLLCNITRKHSKIFYLSSLKCGRPRLTVAATARCWLTRCWLTRIGV
jgi:hypothetical protein